MNPYLQKAASMSPNVVERLVKLIPASEYDKALEPGRFTIREVVAHLADWEPILRQRMEDVLRNPGMTVQVFDEGTMAVEHRYAEKGVQESIQEWKRERAQTLVLLMELTDKDMLLPYIHPENGPMILGDQANMLVAHDMYHVDQLSRYL